MSKDSKKRRDAKKKLLKKRSPAITAQVGADCCTPWGCSDSGATMNIDLRSFGMNR
ncbi:hypothetical protein [Mycolicibacterium palauense]|uniref:hypothetical protein n=1 Tax=Mycolicibacterium palauense TaxID=2034511 RepID=UPI00159BA037|nr:hypothetical protein [Mycolicibacterium palauense]